MKEKSREKEKLLVAGVLQDMLAQGHGSSILSLRLVAYWACVAEKRPKDIYHTQPVWASVGHGRERGRGAHMHAVGSASEKFLS